MIRLHEWKWTIFICVLAGRVGILHGLTHVEFHEYYTQFLNDIDELLRLTTEYVTGIVGDINSSQKSDKLLQVTEHYNLMLKNAEPLVTLFSNDLKALLTFMDTLESINMMKKFLYTYFRQSAINLIDHLKRVYSLG